MDMPHIIRIPHMGNLSATTILDTRVRLQMALSCNGGSHTLEGCMQL
jgi:hypothetical protein